MSLFGALFTGVSGLASQAQSTSMIANNIANVNTVGFKSSSASFYSLVTSSTGAYSPGTVAVNRIQNVGLLGAIQQTASSTDAAVSGNGFFVVKRDVGSQQEYLYTRSGSFSEDNTGLLRNTAGFVLYGWPLDQNGNIPANSGDLTSLKPVDVAFLGGLTKATTTANMSLNLNATEKDATLNGSLTSAPNFSRGLTVYDSLGAPQILSMQFTKTYGPQGTAAGIKTGMTATDNLMTDLGLTSGQQFTVTSDLGVTRTYDVGTAAGGNVVVSELGDIINDINNNLNGVSAFLGSSGELVIQRDAFTGGATQYVTVANVGAGTSLGKLGITTGQYKSDDLSTLSASTKVTGTASGLTTGATLASLGLVNGQTLSVSKEGGPATTYTIVNAATETVNSLLTFFNGIAGISASINSSGSLEVNHTNTGSTASLTFGGSPAFLGSLGLTTTPSSGIANNYANGSAADTPPYSNETFPAFQNLPGSANYNNRGWWQMKVVMPDGSTLKTGLINFNSDGTINAQKDVDGNIDLNLTQINWGNGSASQNINLDVSAFTNFSGNYNVISSNQNGAALGLRTGVEITREGFVVAQFSNGATAKLYKVPLATFSNADGLTEQSGTAYTKNDTSGEENLREAGSGGAGFLTPSSVEASNVDLADEFAKLIVSQRAFSANTKVITTVDQMTQDLLQLR
ncbi:MAG: Flagellar hook protein FlgE [Micavibrio sp.]|nr:Flagellar hook protein FlgE [Micavibrio sp.]